MTDRIAPSTTQTPAATVQTDPTTAPKAPGSGTKPNLESFSPTERAAAEEMLAAYKLAIGRNTNRA